MTNKKTPMNNTPLIDTSLRYMYPHFYGECLRHSGPNSTLDILITGSTFFGRSKFSILWNRPNCTVCIITAQNVREILIRLAFQVGCKASSPSWAPPSSDTKPHRMLLRSHGGGNCSGDGGAHEGEPALHPTAHSNYLLVG